MLFFRRFVLSVLSLVVGAAVATADQKTDSRMQDQKNESMKRLQTIGYRMVTYIDKFGDGRYYPQKLADLYNQKLLAEPKAFIAPADEHPAWTLEGDLQTSYRYAGECITRRILNAESTDFMLCWERSGIHPGGRSVLFLAGYVKFLTEDEWRQEISKLQRIFGKDWKGLPLDELPPMPSKDVEAKVDALIKRLGHESHAERETAAKELKGMGSGVAAVLAKDRNHPDPETRKRVQEILRQWGYDSSQGKERGQATQ